MQVGKMALVPVTGEALKVQEVQCAKLETVTRMTNEGSVNVHMDY